VTERVEGIGGVFFRSDRPEELATWYREHLGIEPAPDFVGTVFAAREGDRTVWSIFPADATYFAGALMVNYRVRDLDAMLAQLREAGVEVSDDVHDSEYGRFGWATDPDGNRLELWEPR
jgi:predicted enzyme related to lactoylglutathione lyase